MTPDFVRRCWFLTGPTASGKSDIAILLAERFHAEIIALDSMTLYRGMDIGTGKPTAEDRRRVPHHLIDILDASESPSLEHYLTLAAHAVEGIESREHRPLFVGGTPLYLKALLRGIFDAPPPDVEFRSLKEEEARLRGSQHLHEELQAIDPVAALRIPPADTRRIIRALEVWRHTGIPISHWQREFDRPASPAPPVACILRPRKEAHARINQRVLRMFRDGWIDEVQKLLNSDPPPSRVALQAVGYKEIAEFLEEPTASENALIDLIQTRTRQIYKRQVTWFRHMEECVIFETSENEDAARFTQRLADYFESKMPLASEGLKPAQ